MKKKKTYFLHLGFNTLGLTLGFSQNWVVLFSSFHVFPQCGAKILLSSLRGRKAESCGSRLVSKSVCAKLLQSCPTVRYPMNHSLPGSSVHGIIQARLLEWLPCPPLFPTQGLYTHLLHLLGLTLTQPS